ncbi:hypothetical protein B8W73_04890 [Arthrobacter agilis]|nr:hypothetical protein B8W73_04890 [Arthrobacter agilis]
MVAIKYHTLFLARMPINVQFVCKNADYRGWLCFQYLAQIVDACSAHSFGNLTMFESLGPAWGRSVDPQRVVLRALFELTIQHVHWACTTVRSLSDEPRSQPFIGRSTVDKFYLATETVGVVTQRRPVVQNGELVLVEHFKAI